MVNRRGGREFGVNLAGDAVTDIHEPVFLIVFAVLTFAVPIFVAWASYSDKTPIDVRSLWTHHERIDKLAIIMMGTWWVHTTSMILWTLMQKVVTADYLTYTLWGIPIIAKMFAPETKPPETKGPTL